jgi:hypothetical protein
MLIDQMSTARQLLSLCGSQIDHFVMAITSAEAGSAYPLPSDDLSCRPYRDAVFENLSQEAKPMPSKSKITTAAPFRRNHSMDPAMKAGIGAIACSVLFLGFVLLAIHTLPVSIG